MTKYLGIDVSGDEMDSSGKRYSVIIKNGEIISRNIEANVNTLRLSGPNRLIDQLVSIRESLTEEKQIQSDIE
jgi:peroxiredoxin